MTEDAPEAEPELERQDIGFIGLGNIGGALAANLLADGHRLSVFDIDPIKVVSLTDAGASAAASVAKVAKASDVTFLSLPTPEAMEVVADAWLGASAGSHKVLVDLTTNSPSVVRKMGNKLAASGTHLVEAPLTGGAPGARNRQLVFIVGSDDAGVFARIEPLLRSLGRGTFLMGPLGSGNIGKLANSLHAFASMWVTLETLALAAKSGVDLRTLVDMLRVAGGATPYLNSRVENIGTRGAPADFSLELAAKDAGLMIETGREVGVPLPVASVLHEMLTFAKAQGLGARDISDLVEVIERLAGIELELSPPSS
jgi:3-hydroxyisobutyrate dehydrogenase-like beta-hydroxyacid dehydrogenase